MPVVPPEVQRIERQTTYPRHPQSAKGQGGVFGRLASTIAPFSALLTILAGVFLVISTAALLAPIYLHVRLSSTLGIFIVSNMCLLVVIIVLIPVYVVRFAGPLVGVFVDMALAFLFLIGAYAVCATVASSGSPVAGASLFFFALWGLMLYVLTKATKLLIRVIKLIESGDKRLFFALAPLYFFVTFWMMGMTQVAYFFLAICVVLLVVFLIVGMIISYVNMLLLVPSGIAGITTYILVGGGIVGVVLAVVVFVIVVTVMSLIIDFMMWFAVSYVAGEAALISSFVIFLTPSMLGPQFLALFDYFSLSNWYSVAIVVFSVVFGVLAMIFGLGSLFDDK